MPTLDFTIHFWPMVIELAALSTFLGFVWHIGGYIKGLVNRASQILEEHHEMYAWYQKMKAQGVGD